MRKIKATVCLDYKKTIEAQENDKGGVKGFLILGSQDEQQWEPWPCHLRHVTELELQPWPHQWSPCPSCTCSLVCKMEMVTLTSLGRPEMNWTYAKLLELLGKWLNLPGKGLWFSCIAFKRERVRSCPQEPMDNLEDAGRLHIPRSLPWAPGQEHPHLSSLPHNNVGDTAPPQLLLSFAEINDDEGRCVKRSSLFLPQCGGDSWLDEADPLPSDLCQGQKGSSVSLQEHWAEMN